MPTKAEKRDFGAALRSARASLRVDRWTVASACAVLPRTLARWEAGESWPSLEDRITLLHLLIQLSGPKLRELAELAGTTLEQAGLAEALRPANAVAGLAPVAPTPPSATAQKAIDDALRDAAEDLAVHASALRPVASRLLEAIAKTGVTFDVAARMVIGVPKRAERPAPAAATTPAPPAADGSST